MLSPTRRPSQAFAAIVGRDPGLEALLARAARVAPTRVPVLVTGESGTGKELLARALHELGPAPGGAFVTVNCGALSRELAESELFGHERGAFTGAGARRAGWFEEASGGTLVLDEIGELPQDLQPKLLRVLETGHIRRVGGTGETPVRVRVVAMTLRELRREVERGAFRLDLYHRLAGFELALPPLRRRLHDVPLLARHFLDELARELGPRTLTPAALERLARHDWPGNVRELRNVLRRAAILCDGVIDDGALELEAPGCDLRLAGYAADAEGARAIGAPRPLQAEPGAPEGADTLALPGRTFAELERTIFAWALDQHGGSRRRAARALGISRSTFCDRVKRLGLAAPAGRGFVAPAARELAAAGASPASELG
jgi:two-component system nitrogen regulation response regulator GlnG